MPSRHVSMDLIITFGILDGNFLMYLSPTMLSVLATTVREDCKVSKHVNFAMVLPPELGRPPPPPHTVTCTSGSLLGSLLHGATVQFPLYKGTLNSSCLKGLTRIQCKGPSLPPIYYALNKNELSVTDIIPDF